MTPSTTAGSISRRGFLAGSGAAAGAFVFGFSLVPPQPAVAQSAPAEVNAWVVVQRDDTVIIRIARTEMGQGSLTGLAQLVAEELECDWAKVRFELVKPGANRSRQNVWRDLSTGGSRAIRGSHEYVRRGGATARAMLVQAAAEGWNVPAAQCTVSKGVIRHAASGRQTTYGAVAASAARLQPPENVPLKDPKLWTIAGQPLKRIDTLDKLDGSLVYGADFRMPGMLVAVPKACPVHGGKLVSFGATEVLKRRGVKQVLRVDESTVAVVADTFWRAKTALEALPITWDEGPAAQTSSQTIADLLREGLAADKAYVGHQAGDARAVLGRAAQSPGTRLIEAEYSYPYQNHAPMEILAATVRWTPERCEMWGPTQVADAALDEMARAAGLPASACEVHNMRIGGSFGRRLYTDYVRIATLIARQVPNTPVKMMWTREEDMAQGRYHPVSRCRLRAALDDKGQVQALHMRIAGQSIFAYHAPARLTPEGGDPIIYQGLVKDGAEMAIGYTFPHLLVDHAMRNPHVRPGAWRGVNLNQNAVYLECFIDELAHAAGADPLTFRRQLMAQHPKHLAVLEAAARGIGWGSQPAPGIGRGLAQIMGFGAYVAAAAEVSVTDGKLKIHRIVAATDCGHVVNPQQVEAQIAGSFVYGLSAALYGECTVKEGRIEQRNFDTYNVMRLDEMPKVEVIAMPSGGFWGGVGEPTIAVAAPAVLNALFAATGKRVRDLPLKNIQL
ncbi:molybdopterin-dependent oxidoreductase [Aquincola tertiaricarbonis]|uniref:Molybdopterin-dependent oxidoreductase n=1 Tax=Aquincola tertiaricarbonis TaxID=391953 RepID=A0ABY4S8L9_AQUTE|nr:molybdopterin cofactor-binding domain-containing protein [Aquincola tertiaricarbonis]URI08550.1 molybdopterin-dependent oxidoreductase [Aquincola tertiaricarbonis]